MPTAGISGAGVISALGRNCRETAARFASGDYSLPQRQERFESSLDLCAFTLPDRLPGDFEGGYPLWFLLQALDEALGEAKLDAVTLRQYRVGIVIGTTVACQLDNIPLYRKLRSGQPYDGRGLLNYINGIPAEYLRRRYGLQGPAVTVSNACASGSDALLIAKSWLDTGRCDLVIAGGCDSVNKVDFDGFNSLRVVSEQPCKPFAADRDGLNLGDAAGVLILEEPDQAAKRGVCQEYRIAGAGKTADGFHITRPEGSGEQLERSIRLALNEAGLTPDAVDFVNAHGTGTRANDEVEGKVLARIFGDGLNCHSTKAMTGHTLGAAGAIEAVFSLLQLRMRRSIAALRAAPADAALPILAAKPQTIPGNAALSTSLAFGGSNTAIVISRLDGGDAYAGEAVAVEVLRSAVVQESDADRDRVTALCRKYALRRLDRLTQMQLLAADQAAAGLDLMGDDTALITATGYGPAVTTCRVLDDILDYPEQELLPVGFSHSVLNASASYIGSALGIHGPTFAIAGFENVFGEARDLAETLLAARRCRQALIVYGDEASPISEAAERLKPPDSPRLIPHAEAVIMRIK